MRKPPETCGPLHPVGAAASWHLRGHEQKVVLEGHIYMSLDEAERRTDKSKIRYCSQDKNKLLQDGHVERME